MSSQVHSNMDNGGVATGAVDKTVIKELRTMQDFVRWAATSFARAGLTYGHGTDNALDEALQLVLWCLSLPHEAADRCLPARLLTRERREIAGMVARRIAERRPLPYLTGEAWFAGMAFYVDERVVIPRSPIAELVANGFEPWLDGGGAAHILELCTGSACIAVACAEVFPGAQVDAVDLSEDALAVARINVDRYGLEERVHLIHGDLYGGVAARRYDLIVANPPYVGADEHAALPPEYAYEPRLGLESGEQGLACIRRILCEAADHLNPAGILVAEVGCSRSALEQRFPQVPFLWVDFQRGGEGVFVVTAAELQRYREVFCSAPEAAKTE